MTDTLDQDPPMPTPRRGRGRRAVAVLAVIPAIVVLVALLAPLRTDFAYQYSGLATDADARLLGGQSTIDGNAGVTSQALGTRAALDVLGGHLPLWNHYEGLGAPLLGEMQAAALFPPTWLMALPHGQAIAQALLQYVAGLGAFLFFRRFGLGSPASLAGGLRDATGVAVRQLMRCSRAPASPRRPAPVQSGCVVTGSRAARSARRDC